MECMLCKNRKITLLHKGCRDRTDINMVRCEQCGLVFADTWEHLKENLYEESGMHQNEGFCYETWLEQTEEDDRRRAEKVKSMTEHQGHVDVLDFGCGNGGFLRHLKDCPDTGCFGVELERAACHRLNADGIVCKEKITEYDRKFDVITMFHVIEHLTEPQEWLLQISSYLKEDGILIIETPNADDVLLRTYRCTAFADFTYWSLHVYLYTSQTLGSIAEKAGLLVIENTQIQRYPYTNHLYWLTEGKPGGHKKLSSIYTEKFEAFYEEGLKDRQQCDTLWLTARICPQ